MWKHPTLLKIFILAIIDHNWYISAIVGNTFWLVAISYYFYILFLGFSGKTFLDTKFYQVLLKLQILWIYYESSSVFDQHQSSSLSVHAAHYILPGYN